MGVNIRVVKDVCLVFPDKPATLDPGIREVLLPSLSKKQHRSMDRYLPALLQYQKFQSEKFFPVQIPDTGETLPGSLNIKILSREILGTGISS